MEVERGRETEKETRKRVRAASGAVVPSSKKEDPARTPAAAQERLARLVAEANEAWHRRTAEAKGEPKVDHYALQASQFPDTWNRLWFGYFGSFDDTTKIKPSRFTDEPPPPLIASACRTLQIFSVKVGGIGDGLQWPLQVFGMVALRDSIDHNRNIIFQRTRDNCQTLTEKDPCLALTGPVRAVVSLGPVTFEVKLTVKGTTESDDKDLSALAVPLLCNPDKSCSLKIDYTSKLSTLWLSYGHLRSSVEASISVLVSSGASLGRVQCVASTASIDDDDEEEEEAILLDSADGEVPVTGDGVIKLSRHVVSVEVNGKLKVSVLAWRQGDNKAVKKWKEFTPKRADRSHGMLNFVFCRMKITIDWSLITVDASRCGS